jgi:hypothetical protein
MENNNPMQIGFLVGIEEEGDDDDDYGPWNVCWIVEVGVLDSTEEKNEDNHNTYSSSSHKTILIID